jgi:CheY-like chemotaxis protein
MILLVDDDEAVRKTLPYVLESAGYPVACADGGHAAITWLESNDPPDLVLLDLRMPEMDGNAVLAYVAARNWGNGGPPPIVVLTAFPGDLCDDLRPVAKEVQEKPLYGEKLLEVISRYVRSDRG